MNLRPAWKTVCALAWALAPMASAGSPARQPNFIIIFMDDAGYADVGCFGAKTFKTPRIDSLATNYGNIRIMVACASPVSMRRRYAGHRAGHS